MDEGVEQGDGGIRVGGSGSGKVGAGLFGGDAYDTHPVAAGRELFGPEHEVAGDIQFKGVVVPEVGDPGFFLVEVVAFILDLFHFFVIGAVLIGHIKFVRRRGYEFADAVHDYVADLAPVWFHSRSISGRRWYPAAGGVVDHVFRGAAGFEVAVLFCPGHDDGGDGIGVLHRGVEHVAGHAVVLREVLYAIHIILHAAFGEGDRFAQFAIGEEGGQFIIDGCAGRGLGTVVRPRSWPARDCHLSG